MGEKDISEKLLEEYNDVFADIVNVLLFDGQQIVREGALIPAATASHYKADNAVLHEQERDISKTWTDQNVVISLFGIENQSRVDKDMPLRVLSYDGVSYRTQLLKGSARYPVVTIVLNFSDQKWNRYKRLKDVVHIPAEVDPYVNDYKMNVFDICYLMPETVKKFKSDFGIVADYFVQKTNSHDYVPSDKEINHVDEVLKFLSVFTKDKRFLAERQNITRYGKGGPITMCEVLDKFIDRGIKQGREQGVAQGIAQGVAQGVVQGEDRLGKLIRILIKDNKISLVEEVTLNKEMRDALYKKYGIE